MRKQWWIFVVVLLVLVACNLPGEAATSSEGVQTAAAMTVQAALTQSGGQAGTTPAPQGSPTTPPAVTVLPSSTPVPTTAPTPTPKPCNLATFIKDVTVPDGTVFKPGEHFTKTWRLKNVGTCTWQNYALVFDSGAQMSAPPVVSIPGTVGPGQTVDVSVDLVAPNSAGTYKGYWRLRDDKGVVFSLTSGNPFWVEIKVVPPTQISLATPTMPMPSFGTVVISFYDAAPQAQWTNGHDDLPFPGQDNDSRGFARYADAYMLEDGYSHSNTLETHPEWVADGSILGAYPPVTLPEHAHFRAELGFIAAADGGCGGGDVTFQLLMRTVNTAPHPLGEWHLTCTGALMPVDVDLSAYAGQQLMFMLQVLAGPSSGQDWAVWVDPVVETP